MSWEAYKDGMLALGAIHCGVYSKEGATCCQSDNFSVSMEEILKVVKVINDRGGSFEINKQPCVLLTANEDFTQGKTKAACYENSKIFYHCEVSKTLLVIVGMSGPGEREASNIANKYIASLKASNY